MCPAYGAAMKRTLILTALLLVAPTALASGSPSPSRFVRGVTNPWFPLRPGTVIIRDKQFGVPHIYGVTDANLVCTAVSDRLYLSGRLGERTTDWYAQDKAGNVWYFGEATAELDARGKVTSREGSWLTGVNGAEPGVFMPAHPRVGQSARQEYYKGHAEDHFRVLSLSAHVRTPAASSSHALLTKEWTPLEPGVIDHKRYVRGIGTVLEQTVKGGDERNTLVSIHRP